MTNLDWTGMFPSLVTPFDTEGELDAGALSHLAEFAVRAGADGILANALAGEVMYLRSDERPNALAAVLDGAGGAIPVLAGVGAASVEESCELARAAARQGADGVCVPVLSPAGHTRDELIADLLQVARSVDLPVMIQDAPAYLGGELGLEVVETVAELADNVRHLKVEGGSVAMERARRHLGCGIGLWAGDGGRHLLDCLRSGATGVMPGVEVIDALVEIAAAERGGDPVGADRLLSAALPLIVFQMQSLEQYVGCAKAILRARGLLDCDRARGGVELTGLARRILAGHLASVHLPDMGSEVIARLERA